jgi:4-amino-4-deoxy-L-arabinose transferase-like glycosyltransferase
MNQTSSPVQSFLANPTTKMVGLAACVIFVLSGQYLISSHEQISEFGPLIEAASRLNNFLHLWLEYPLNVFSGLLAITIGGILYGFISRSPARPECAKNSNSDYGKWQLSKLSKLWLIASFLVYAVIAIQVAKHRYTSLLFQGWLLALLIPTSFLWINDRRQGKSLSLQISRLDGIWIFILFGSAIAAGTYLLNDLPAGWISDEGAFWEMARRISLGEVKPGFFDFGVYSFPVASSIFQGWVLRLTGVSMWGWRFASVLPASASVIALYLLAREIFDRRVAVAASIIMIANPYFLSFARLGYNNSQSLFTVTSTIYFFVLGIRKNSFFYFWLSGLIAGLGFYTYFAAWLGWVAIILMISTYPLLSRESFRKPLIPLGLIVVSGATIILPRILYGMSSDTSSSLHYKIWETSLINTLYGKAIFGEERLSRAVIFLIDKQVEVYYDPALYIIALLRGLILSIAALFDPINYHDHYITYGLAGPVSSVFLVLGLALTLANLKQLPCLVVGTWFLAGMFFLGILASIPPRPTHLVAVIPAMALLSAIGLISFLNMIFSQRLNLQGTIISRDVFLTGILIVVTGSGLLQYFFTMPHIYTPSTSDYASWMGRQITKQTNLIFVDVDPIEFATRNENDLKLSKHQFITVTRADLADNPDQTQAWGEFVAFIGPGDSEKYAVWLSNQIPGAKAQPAYGPSKNLRGYMVSNLSVPGSMDYGITHGLQSLWSSPARDIILVSYICALVLIVTYHQTKYHLNAHQT